MKNKQLLALASEAIQLKDELLSLESIREAEKKKEHDKLIVTEPTDRLGQFFWEHAREKYIHDAKETQLGNFNVPAYNFCKSVQALHAKFIILKSEVASLEVEDNDEFKDKLHQLAQNLSVIEDCFLSINEIAMIAACYRQIELTLDLVESSLTEVRWAADDFNNNPSMASYKKLCSTRDFFARNTAYLAYEINALQRDVARNPKQDRIEAAYALNKVLDSSRNDLALLDNDIENLRYKYSGILYEGLDDLQDSYEGSVLSYLKCYWIITLSYLYAQFMGLSVTATSSAEQLDETVMEHSIDDEEGYGPAEYAH